MKENQKEILYPVGIQSFEKIREGGFLYVDKTAFIFPLIKNEGYYFLSRPRRFGKSLLLSTIEAYYKGRRDLFRGLALDSLTDEWDAHPVFHLDLNTGEYNSPGDLESLLNFHLIRWEKEYNIEWGKEEKFSPSLRFSNLIRQAYRQTGKKVVILVDEYDKPLLNAIGNEELADIYRSQLKAFYSNLKTMDPFIKMAMLTGVARFSKVSIFSDLNNLRDISFVDEFSSICGITSDELDEYFRDGIQTLAEKRHISFEESRERLRRNYDGYHFSEDSPDMYNPYSLIYSFANKTFGRYWYDSGTPSYLVKLLNKGFFIFSDIAPCHIDKYELESAGLLSENPIPAFYQSGYLTIKGYDPKFNTYDLDYPNMEVKEGFLTYLLKSYTRHNPGTRGFSVTDFAKEVYAGDAQGFMQRMTSLVAAVPYSEHGTSEDHFRNVVYLLFTLLGFYCHSELRTSDGRIDLKVTADKYIYIFEFKIDKSSQDAMNQIEDKKYWIGDMASGKEIILIGANFDTKTAHMDDPVIRALPCLK